MVCVFVRVLVLARVTMTAVVGRVLSDFKNTATGLKKTVATTTDNWQERMKIPPSAVRRVGVCIVLLFSAAARESNTTQTACRVAGGARR